MSTMSLTLAFILRSDQRSFTCSYYILVSGRYCGIYMVQPKQISNSIDRPVADIYECQENQFKAVHNVKYRLV